VAMTIANVILNILLIPKYGTFGAALGTAIASVGTSGVLIWLLFSGRLVIRFSRGISFKPDWPIIRELFRFGLPTGIQGIAMNLAGLLMVRFIGSLQHSAEAQAAYAVGYTELFSLITWTSVGLMGAAAAVAGQNLGAGHPDRAAQSPAVAARIGLGVAAIVGLGFVLMPRVLLGAFALTEGVGFELGRELLAYLAVSGFFVTVALCYTGGLQGTGDTKSPLYISIVSQVIVPVGLCSVIEATGDLAASDIWLAIVLGHATRATLSVLRFQQGKWRNIRVAVPRPAAE